jgi:SAM-dependent methyltransferase
MNRYFKKRAYRYLDKSHRVPWKYFRHKEREAIARLLDAKVKTSLVDLGSGAGYYSLFFKEKYYLDVFAIDSSSAMIKELKNNGIASYLGSIENLELKRTFDNAIAAGVLEFVESPTKCFESMSRLLKLKGRLVIMVPPPNVFGWIYKKVHQFFGCFVIIRSLEEYEKIAEQYGFKKINQHNPTIISRVICFEKIKKNNER